MVMRQKRWGQFSSVQSLSHASFSATPWTAALQASLSITNSQCLLKLRSIESVMPSNHLLLCHPLLLSPSIFSTIRVFSNESALHIRWPKYWSFSFSIRPSKGLISFRMDWLDHLAVQGTLKSLLQHHSSIASFLLCSAFFLVQLSHPYMTTGKIIALTRQTFVGSNVSAFYAVQIGHSFFSNKSLLHIRWPEYQSFSFNISPFNQYSGLIFFRIDWFDLAVQGTLKSLLQHHSSIASILQRSAFFIVQLSHPYMTTGKIIALTRQTFVGN